jgi:hypothetical protein
LPWSSFTANQIKQVDFNWIQGEPYLLASYSLPVDANSVKRDRLHQPYNIVGQSEAQNLLVNARTGTVAPGFDVEQMVARLDASITDASVTEYEVLQSYDDYYYSRQSQLPLPVLRIKFDDPVTSWIYVDPERSELLTTVNTWSRLERWLYNGLHSLDFAFWYHQRPLWDIGVIMLLLGGLGTSLIGLYFGLRRLGRDVEALVSKLKNHKSAKEAVHAAH